MRMQLLKIVVVLLVAGSGDTRPQSGADSQPKTTEWSDAGWRGVQVSSKSHDIVRDDSRYTGTSGSSRKSYITHFRGSADSSREHNAVGSRASDFARTGATARSFNARRSKIDDIWTTMPEFRAINAPPRFSRTDALGEIAKIATVRSSSEANGSRFRVSPTNSKTIQNERTVWTGFNPDLGVGRTNHSGKMNTGNLERSKSGVTSNKNLASVAARTRYSSAGNVFAATHASGSERMNDGVSVAAENRRKSGSVRSDSFPNRDIVGGDTSSWKSEQDSNSSSLQIAGTNVPSDSQAGASHSAYKNRNSIRKNTNGAGDPIAISHEGPKPSIVADSSRHTGGNQRDGLNNSRRSTHGAGTRPSLIPNSKSEVVGRNRAAAFPRRNAVTSHRNLVKLRYPYLTSNRRNASNVALNTRLKNNEIGSTGVQSRRPVKGHLTRTAAKKPVSLNNHKSKPTKNSHSSSVHKSSSQGAGGGNKTGAEYGGTPVQYNGYLKNWPNEALQDIEDLYNYEKYTSSLEEESSHDAGLPDADGTPIFSSNGSFFDHPDPIIDSSVKKIIHWLKVPEIVPNNTQFLNYNGDVHKPLDSVLESIYENLEPNHPLSVSAHDSNYETTVLQDASPNQDLDKIDYHTNYPIRWSNPSSIAHPQYATGSLNPSATLTPSSWSDMASLRNKTVYNPTTHVTQNTVVHILDNGLKEPNVTVTELKEPETDMVVADQVAASGSSSDSSELGVQRPNVHIMFTSQKDEDKGPPKQETNTYPSSTHNTKCPTIMINTYTRVNNTIQSKEGCTDLNIVVNSHVSSVFTPSGAPAITEDQQTPLATQGYGDADENEKYAEAIADLSHQDSSNYYVTASTGSYGSSPLEVPRPDQHNYYDSQKDPSEIPGPGNDPAQSSGLSTIEVFQGTQISVSGSSVLLADAEATASPAGSSVDGPAAVGPGDDASSSAVNPPVAGASASGPPLAESLGSANPPAPAVAQELPAYLIRPGPIKGQSNNALVPGSLQLPALPSLPNIAVKPGLSSIGSPSLSPSSSGSLSDDDDDDDDFDISPGSVLQSIASVFTYFSFFNPLSYSIFSLAAAPFAAMAAGILGVAAVVFPLALPGVFDFGRSANRVTYSFAPSLEEFVRRAVHKYDRLNEWKSRRRKRRS